MTRELEDAHRQERDALEASRRAEAEAAELRGKLGATDK